MKILVIGASSFTGKNFCEYARGKGADVHEVSLRDLKKLSAVLAEPQEYVVNFAALNVVAPSWKYPSDYLFTNVYALTSIVDILKDRPIKRFVQISTPEVFGSTEVWIKEHHKFYPSTPYAVSRAAAEMMLRAYMLEYNMPVAITRSCNVYGPGQQLYRLIPKLIMCVKSGKKFPLEGKGLSRRAFLHVHDAVDAIWRITSSTQEFVGGPYHISPHKMYPIRAIVKMVCNRLGVKLKDVVEMVPERPGKDDAYMLDSERIREQFGWSERISLTQGIDQCVRWIEDEWETLANQSLEYVHRP